MPNRAFAGPALRVWHQYIGLLIAPTVLFFSLTGIVQILNLHQSHVGYDAPAVLKAAAMVHKDQLLPEPREPGGEGAKGDGPQAGGSHAGGSHAGGHKDGGPGGGERHGGRIRPAPSYTLPQALLKGFFILAALGLIASTCLGVVLSLQNKFRRTASLVALAAGVLIPIVLLLL